MKFCYELSLVLQILCLNFQLSVLHQPWSVFDASSAGTQYTAGGDLSLMISKLQVPKGLVDENVSQVVKS